MFCKIKLAPRQSRLGSTRMDTEDMRAQMSFSTFPQTLKQAENVLQLAEERSEDHTPLAACATIMLATALAQMISISLDGHATFERTERKCELNDTEAGRTAMGTLRHQMTELPKILSRGRYELDSGNPAVRALHRLIDLRNELVHVSEKTIVERSPQTYVSSEGEHRVKLKGGPLPQNPWVGVSIEGARKFQRAVVAYVENFSDMTNLTFDREAEFTPSALLRRSR